MERKNLIGHEIKIVSNLIKRKIAQSKVLIETDKLTGMHGFVIGYIYHKGIEQDVFQRDLEEEFSIRRSTATGILQLMEKNGLLIREPVAYDARLKKLVLTPKAIAIHEEITREIDRIEGELLEGITEEELDSFYRVLNKIKKNVE